MPERELVPIKPEIVRSDGSDGRPPGSFVSGTGGVKRGHKHRITNALREEWIAYAEKHGKDANPLLVLAQVMVRDDVPWHVRVQAAGKLCDYLIPKQFAVDDAPSNGAVAEETLTLTRRIRSYFTENG